MLKRTITGIVATDSILVCATSSDDSAVSLLYFAAYIAVFVATGADAEITRAVRILPSTPTSLNTKSIISGTTINLISETK